MLPSASTKPENEVLSDAMEVVTPPALASKANAKMLFSFLPTLF